MLYSLLEQVRCPFRWMIVRLHSPGIEFLRFRTSHLRTQSITRDKVQMTNLTRILVVDDDAAMREVLEMRLQEWGFDVCLASNGNQALELTESYEPDIVVSDVLMPGLSGLELLRFLKMARQAHPVILITVQASVDV